MLYVDSYIYIIVALVAIINVCYLKIDKFNSQLNLCS